MNQDEATAYFPPGETAEIETLPCQLAAESGIPLNRFGITEIV